MTANISCKKKLNMHKRIKKIKRKNSKNLNKKNLKSKDKKNLILTHGNHLPKEIKKKYKEGEKEFTLILDDASQKKMQVKFFLI